MSSSLSGFNRNSSQLRCELEFLLHRAQRMVVSNISTGRYVPTIRSRAASLRRAIAEIDSMSRNRSSADLEQQDQWRFRRQRLQCLGHLAQHPLLRHALILVLQTSAVLAGASQLGHLREPCRRERVENFDHPFAAGFPAEATQRFQHRHVRLAPAVLLDALATSDARGALLLDPIRKV